MPKSRSRWFLVGGIAFLALAVPLAISSLLFSKETEAWFDPGYGYRKRIDVTNGSGNNLTDYQVKITFDSAALISAGKMQSDCDDIRVTGRNGQVLPYVLDIGPSGCNQSATNVWVKASSIPASGGTVYFYYGNPAATSAQNGNAVFLEYDLKGFTEVDPNSHLTVDSSAQITTTNLSSNEDAYIYKQITPRTTGTIDFDIKRTSGANKVACVGVATTLDDCKNTTDAAHLIWSWSGQFVGQLNGTTKSGNVAAINAGTQYYVTIKYNGTNVTYSVYSDAGRTTLLGSQSQSYSSSFSYLYALSSYNDGSGATINDTVTNFHLRQYASSEVTVSPASEEVAPGPIAYWRFDEGQGQTINNSGGGSTGTLGANASAGADDPVWVSDDQCVSGKCLRFDGSDDFVDGGRDFSWAEGESYSIGAWIRTNNLTAVRSIFGKVSYEYSLVVSTTGVLQYNHWSSGGSDLVLLQSSTTISPNRWYFVQITKDASSAKMYINGELVATDNSVTGTYMNRAETLAIGKAYSNIGGGATRYFNGSIDEVKVYPYARTAEQVRQDYNQGALKLSSGAGSLGNGLVGYWKFDEGTGTAVTDYSGYNQTLSITYRSGVNPSAWASGKFGSAYQDAGYNYPDDESAKSNWLAPQQSDFSVSLWIRPSSTEPATSGYIISRWWGDCSEAYQPGWGLRYTTSTNKLTFRIAAGSCGPYGSLDSNLALTPDTWYNVVIVHKTGESIKIYINGELDSSVPYTLGLNPTPPNLSFGCGANNNDCGYPGLTDEARIYNRALSQSEVTNLYNYAPGPIAHLKLDDNTGTTAADSSGSGNNGALTNGPTWVTGRIGKALKFDGTNDYITIPNPAVGSLTHNQGTIGMWMNKNSTSERVLFMNRSVYSGSNGIEFYTSNSGALCMRGSSDTAVCTANSIFSTGSWVYVTFVYSGTTGTIYINGAQSATGTIATVTLSTQPLIIGAYSAPTPSGYYFDGILDDVRIYNYVRTPAQIQEDMSGGVSLGVTGTALPDPVAYYKFDEEVGQTVNNSGVGGSVLSGTFGANSSSSTDDPAWKASADCKINGCASFDGGDFVSFTNSPVIGNSTNFSISTWFKPSIVTGTQRIMYGEFAANDDDSRHQFGIYGTTSKLIFDQFPPSGGWIETADPLMADTWYHVVYAQSGSNRKLYINGKLVSSDAAAETYSGVVPTLAYIGARRVNGSLTQNFIGLIDEFKIYNTPLTQDQIFQDMNAGSAMDFGSRAAPKESLLTDGTGDSPVSVWTFDEKTGTAALDMSGSNNTANFNGGASWASGTCREGACVNLKAAQSQYVVSSQPISLGSSQTYEVWFKPNTSSPGNIMNMWSSASIGAHHHPLFYMDGTNLYGCLWNMGYTLINSSISPGNWYHAAMVYNSTNTTLYYYLNGSLMATDNTGSRSGTTTQFFSFGASETQACSIPGYTAAYFDGQIDKAVVYNAARTAAQVAYDYNGGKPVAHWKLDECEGTTIHDSSGNGLHGTLTVGGTGSQTSAGTCSVGSTAWGNGASGKYGASLNFDGTDDRLVVPDNDKLDGHSSLSVSFWAKPLTSSVKEMVIKHSTGTGINWELYQNGTNVTGRINGTGGDCTSTGSKFSVGSWHHVSMVWSGTQIFLYIDGVLNNTCSRSTTLPNTTGTLGIGGYGDGSYSFNGPIDDVRIYNYALSPSQVAQVMNEGSAMRFGE